MDGASPHRFIKVHRDRVITEFPKSYSEHAVIDKSYDFNPRARQLCQSNQSSSIGLKICKMIVIGDVGVGKTSLVTRFCKKAFDKDYKATIGVDFEVERFEILGSPFTLQMWDTAGQERFQCIAAAYYRGAHVVTIVFDLSEIETLRNARVWLQAAMTENQGANDIKVFLVGTKKDLLSQSAFREVQAEAIDMARNLNAEFWATSSLSGDNVKEFFFRVAALAFQGMILSEEKKRQSSALGDGNLVSLKKDNQRKPKSSPSCCKA